MSADGCRDSPVCWRICPYDEEKNLSAVRLSELENTKCPRPHTAMVLSAGLGKRMQPLTLTTPKPLIPVLGKTMLDRHLDRLAEWGVEKTIVNVHHLADKIREHVKDRKAPVIKISDETDALLETGGGVARALPLLGDDPFFVLNGDVVWNDGPQSTFTRLWQAFDPDECDVVLLMHPVSRAHGYDGHGDFHMDPHGSVRRRGTDKVAPYVFAGVQLLHPNIMADYPEGAFSLNVIYDRAMEAGRLRAVVHDGDWYHVGTPDSVTATEHLMSDESMNSY